MKLTLPGAAAAVLLATGPGWSQVSTDWRVHRDLFLSEARHLLMEYCAVGRILNSRGVSYWRSDVQDLMKAGLRAPGVSQAAIDAIAAGQAAAMGQVCPEVR